MGPGLKGPRPHALCCRPAGLRPFTGTCLCSTGQGQGTLLLRDPSALSSSSDKPVLWAPQCRVPWEQRHPDRLSHPSCPPGGLRGHPLGAQELGSDRSGTSSYPDNKVVRGKPSPHRAPSTHGWSLSPQWGRGAGEVAGLKGWPELLRAKGLQSQCWTGYGSGRDLGRKVAQPMAGGTRHQPCNMRSEQRSETAKGPP